MKVYLEETPNESVGGLYPVIKALHDYLPQYGVELVGFEEADVVHAHIAVYRDVPLSKGLVVSSHGMLWSSDNWGKLSSKVNTECVNAYVKADRVITPSRFVAHSVQRSTLVSPRVIPHGITVSEWSRGKPQGYVLWNKARVDSACHPNDMQKLASLIHHPFISTFGNKTHNVSVAGKVPFAKMKELIQGASIYLNTTRESGAPCFGVLEALVSGVPVLSWNIGGNAEVIKHGVTGYLAEYGNFDDLLKGLNFCYENREKLSDNAIEQGSRYDWHQIIPLYIEVYQEALPQEPKVSIVIPNYNLGRFVENAVQSALKQTVPCEVIVVDDGSTDDSLERLKKYPVKVIKNGTNRHVSFSRNNGIRHATGNLILPLDADDRLDPHAVEKLLENRERGFPIVSGKLMLFSENDLEKGYIGQWPNNADRDEQLKGQNRLPYCSMYPKWLWERVNGYRERIRNGVEDADFWTRAFSYGYLAKIIDYPILLYTLRQNSLGKTNEEGSEAWMKWYPWKEHKIPYPTETVHHYNPPLVSFVVPVGPNHEGHIINCVDSILAQSVTDYEIILVNDTGHSLETTLPVRLINDLERKGVAKTRNIGIRKSRGKFIVFLDVDDIAQPGMLKAMLIAYNLVGGWIYGDWNYRNEVLVKEKAKDFTVKDFLTKQLAPITGLYEREHLILVNGFDEEAPGWEDWDIQLKLFENGICGTRVAFPLIFYNMQAGFRREDNFRNKKNVLEYIRKRHKNLFEGVVKMPCGKCGGKKTVSLDAPQPGMLDAGLVKIIYTGPEVQTRTFRPPRSNVTYRVTANRPFLVQPEHVSFFTQIAKFKVVDPPVVEVPQETVMEVQHVQRDAMLSETSIGLPTLGVLKKHGLTTVMDVDRKSDSELLELSSFGPGRLNEVRGAIVAWKK